MPEEIPEGAPYHPYHNPELFEKLSGNKTYAENFWWYVKHPDGNFDGSLFPTPPEKLSKVDLTPEKVVDSFNRYTHELIELKKNEEWAKLPGGGRSLDNFTLYDVYLYGLWDTHRLAYWGVPPNERKLEDLKGIEESEQSLAFVEEAMDLAGHRPKENVIPTEMETDKKPAGATDHPYYHQDEIPKEKRDDFYKRSLDGREFFYELCEAWRQREIHLGRLPSENEDNVLAPWLDEKLDWNKELDRQAKEKGDFTSREVVEMFKQYKQREINKLVWRLTYIHDQGNQFSGQGTEECVELLIATQHLTLFDVWMVGTWDRDWQERRLPYQPTGIYGRAVESDQYEPIIKLIEGGMDILGHRPPNYIPPYPK